MNLKSMGLDGKDHQTTGTSGLARQSSVYALTFEELQNSLGTQGKDFGSMNMDEFLKSIWSAEENQTATLAAANAIGPPDHNLQRQGSLNLPETMSRKTVDEVWKDMFKDEGDVSGGVPNSMQVKQRQPTLGEITLEEFLLKAGVTWEEPIAEPRPVIGSSTAPDGNVFFGNTSNSGFNANGGLGLGFNNSSIGGNQVATLSLNPGGSMAQYSARGNLVGWQGIRTGMMGTSESPVSSGLMLGMSDLGRTVDDSPRSNVASDGFGLSPSPTETEREVKRKGNGIVEKVVERRQRRMIKNRESAARSRARKQAYTLELETEILTLKKQNEELLKKQVEILEKQKKQEQKMADQQHQAKRPCLRRINSWPRID